MHATGTLCALVINSDANTPMCVRSNFIAAIIND